LNISTVSEHQQEQDGKGKGEMSCQLIPISVRVLRTNIEQVPWAILTDLSCILQYAFALSLNESPQNNENTTVLAMTNVDHIDTNSLSV
jgi:hypothetical protein